MAPGQRHVTWWSREYSIRISARRCASAFVLCVVAGTVIVGLLYVGRVSILGWVGRTLVSEDPLQPADAIVVLGGGTPGREMEAAHLYTAGLSSRIVMPREPEGRGVKLLLDRNVLVERPNDLRVRILRELGVPDEAVVRLPAHVDSTFEEAAAVVAWASRHRMASLLIVTSRYHTRRVRWTYDRVAAGRGIAVRVRGADLGEIFTPRDWWRSREGLRTGLFELQKLIAYRVMY